KEAIYHELSMLLTAGMDLKSGLELLIVQQQKPKWAQLLSTIKEQIIAGGSLSEALQQHHDFTPYEYYSIQIGEETGKLSEVLSVLALFYRKRLKQRRQLTDALMYPHMVTLTSLGAVFFMMNFIVPMFADIFQRSGADLPAITQFIVTVSTGTRHYAPIIALALLVAACWFYFQRQEIWLRKLTAALLLKMPIFGGMARKIYLARLCNAMALLT